MDNIFMSGIRTAVFGLAVTAVAVFMADHRSASAAPPAQVKLILDGVKAPDDPRTYPQYDSGDTRSVVDPDGDPDEQSTSHSCSPAAEDCQDGPDDPAQAVYHA